MTFAPPIEHVAPDGRRFTVVERACVHADCWTARCECGVWLTKHDFDATGAERCALEALASPATKLGSHPLERCKRAGQGTLL